VGAVSAQRCGEHRTLRHSGETAGVVFEECRALVSRGHESNVGNKTHSQHQTIGRNNFPQENSMTRYLVLVLLTAMTALGTEGTPSSSVPSDPATLVTFNKDVLPILENNCQTCHRPGGIGPMSR
jgi:hypothetical protein